LVIAVIIAGGVGKRFGDAIPKQFIEVAGKPVIVYTLERMQQNAHIDTVVVVTLKDYIQEVSAYREKYGLMKISNVVEGGSSFAWSFRNGVESLAESGSDDDIVVLHMSIAPLVPHDVLDDVVAVCAEKGNAFSAEPNYMCICQKDGDGYSDTYLEREMVYGLNTPQAIRLGRLRELYAQAVIRHFNPAAKGRLKSGKYDLETACCFMKSDYPRWQKTT
jgi:2-C-methyl-D-erythritol 4-phosphate cytidylyltransferase